MEEVAGSSPVGSTNFTKGKFMPSEEAIVKLESRVAVGKFIIACNEFINDVEAGHVIVDEIQEGRIVKVFSILLEALKIDVEIE